MICERLQRIGALGVVVLEEKLMDSNCEGIVKTSFSLEGLSIAYRSRF